jgi:Resolvase, N terminal domain
MIKGYARVSTDGQTLDAQHSALREAGATQVFSEKQSGAKTDRAALARLVACRYWRSWGELQVPRGPLGRHYHAARSPNADGLGRAS